MKRAWVRPAVAAGFVIIGLIAIAMALRGSIATSEAATPDKSDKPRFVRPDTPTSGPRPLANDSMARYPTSVEQARSSLSIREPQRLPQSNSAQPLSETEATADRYPQLPARDSRYVTQADVRDYRVEQEKQRPIQQTAYQGEPTLAPPQSSAPGTANSQPALLPAGSMPPSALPMARDSAPLVSNGPNTLPGNALVTPVSNEPPGLSTVTAPAPLSSVPSGPTASLSNPPSFSNPPSTNTVSQPTPSGAAGTGRPGPKQLEGAQTPSLVVEKIVPPEIQVGKPAKFSIVVRNVGPGVAQDVEVHDELPAGTQLVNTTPRANRGPRGELIWSIGAVKPNEDVTINVELLPTTEGEIGSVAVVKFAAGVSARTICTRPELVLDVSAPREVLIGEQYQMAIKVTNSGTGVAANVVLSEVVPAGFEHPAGGELEYTIGDLAPNETREVELSLKAVKPGAITNRLNLRGEGPLQASKDLPVTIVAPALEVALEGARRRFLDRQATYTIAISNPGTAPAQDVALVAYLPPGLDFVEANNAGQFDARTRSVHWLLEELPAREMGKVTVTTLPTEPGDLPLRIASTAQRGLAVEKQETIRVEGIAALVFQVVDLSDPIDVNGETTYEIRVANQGSKPAENVQIVATLPGELKPVGAEGPSRHEIVGQQVTFQPLARLTEKSETSYLIRVQAVRAGDVKISVQLKSADLATPVVKEEATRVLSDQ